MSLAGSQQKIFLRLIAALRPHWRQDAGLPNRIQGLFAANRSFGSRDRKLYRELIYTTLRFLPWIEPLLDKDSARATQVTAWLAADLPATRSFRSATCVDWPPCPPTLAAKAAYLNADSAALLPAWVVRHCPAAATPAELEALHTRAAVWLRVAAADLPTVVAEFTALSWTVQASPALPTALELRTDADVTKTKAWSQGLIEVQDLGSQLILESSGISPGGRWLDACAGAGGKTLQLAGLLGASGRIDAHDIRPAALNELRIRAARAGLTVTPAPTDVAAPVAIVPPRPAPLPAAPIAIVASPSGLYDGVLVDAPCSGSGTWRRSPHLKWTTSTGQITHASITQRALLDQFSPSVRPGGVLIYATCSLSRFENEDAVNDFLGAHPEFSAEPPARRFDFPIEPVGLSLRPARHNTDWFFVAVLRRKA